MTWNI